MGNVFRENAKKEFHIWVDPKGFVTYWNMGIRGKIDCFPPENTSSFEDNLLFIPNPKFKGEITPYHNNVSRKFRTEYNLEIHRPELYPSRTQALFACDSYENAKQYEKFHPAHVEGRILINGHTAGDYHYSIHDSGWFDFLCKDMNFDDTIITQSVNTYWKGLPVPGSQPPTWEVLFYGTLQISENSKAELQQKFKE
jgi:hypothetical protein